MNKNKAFPALTALFLLFGLVFLSAVRFPAAASPALQLTSFPTPTPGADGRILYIVQEGDTLWRISAISGLTIDEIRTLNNLSPDDFLVQGQSLLLGLAGPSQNATVAPNATDAAPPADLPPTPTPGPGVGTICVILYEDSDGDALRGELELGLAEGAISLTNRSGTVSLTGETLAGLEPAVCFEEILEGDYNVTVAIPEGYNPTTVLNYALELKAGDTASIQFGAQPNSETIEEIQELTPVEAGGRSPMLGIVGGVLILGGVLLAVFAGRLMRPPTIPPTKPEG
jgi:hypothetical protein